MSDERFEEAVYKAAKEYHRHACVYQQERDEARSERDRFLEQIAAVDEALGAWDTHGLVGRVPTVENLVAARSALQQIAEMQPETHPGWNDEYLKASWVFDAAARARTVPDMSEEPKP